ncbi:MAG: hypothetical protein MJZ64_05765 [Paludibacteraceae bacterium]|nr:hypothetical protein [Paludibacteraceae bacterium]
MGFWEEYYKNKEIERQRRDKRRQKTKYIRYAIILLILVSVINSYYSKYKDYSEDVVSAINKHDYSKAHKKLEKQLQTIQNRGGINMDERIEELYEPYAVKLFTAELNYLMVDDSRENVDRVIMLLGDFRTFGTPVVGVTDIKSVKKGNERYMRSVARFNTLLDNVLARSIALHNQYLADNILPMYKANLRKTLHDSHVFSADEHSYEFTDEAKMNAEIVYQKAVKEKRFVK